MFVGTGFAEMMLGLEGFRVLDIEDAVGDDLVVKVEMVATFSGCASCGVRAVPQERRTVVCRDLECFGRPVRLVWLKRRWRCTEADCVAKTWTETNRGFSCRVLLTRRPGLPAIVDLDRRATADVVEGRKGSDLPRWLRSKGSDWLRAVKVVATDMAGSYRGGTKGLLDHALKVVDGFHVVQAANRVVTAGRCRVQGCGQLRHVRTDPQKWFTEILNHKPLAASDRGVERADRAPEFVDQESETSRPRVYQLSELPAPNLAPRSLEYL